MRSLTQAWKYFAARLCVLSQHASLATRDEELARKLYINDTENDRLSECGSVHCGSTEKPFTCYDKFVTTIHKV